MKKNSLKETIEFVGLSYRIELLKVFLVNILFILGAVTLYIFVHNLIYAILVIVGLLVADYLLLSRFKDKKNMVLKARENELVAIISYFQVYVQNKNNVYQSFNLLLPYCSPWMKDKVETLLKEIDQDKSVQPFINFARNFQQLVSQSLMLSIYQMVEQGENSNQIKQFSVIFDEISKSRNKEMIEQKEKSLSNMATFPLIGAGLITMTLTISILMIMGDVMNVI